MSKAVLSALATVLIASSATAQAPAVAQSDSSEKAKNPADRVVCEVEEKTGSRLGARRVCLTVFQWEEKRREHRDATERVQRIVNQSPAN